MKIRPSAVVFAAVLVLLSLVVAFLMGRLDDADQSKADGGSSPTADSSQLVNQKLSIDSRVDQFVAAYYDRDDALYRGSEQEAQQRYEERLRPHVTEGFMTQYVPAISLPPSWEGVGSVDIRAHVLPAGRSGHMVDPKTAEQIVLVEFVQRVDGKIVSKNPLEVTVVLVDRNDTWLVYSVSEQG